jgi:hypothetical protein
MRCRARFDYPIIASGGRPPVLVRAAEDRPVSRRAYLVLNTCRSGTTESTDAIFILTHPLPLVSARRTAGAGGIRVRKFLALGS